MISGISAVGVLQARTASTRLPGKILKPLLGRVTLLECIWSRVQSLGFEWWLATSDDSGDDFLADRGEELGFRVFRGEDTDVLSRYEQIAFQVDSEFIVKINGDNPTVGAEGISLMLEEAEARLKGFGVLGDFSHSRLYPQGHLPQIIRRDALLKIRELVSPGTEYHLTHVTSRLLEEFSFQTNISLGQPEPSLRWTIDTRQDLRAMSALFSGLRVPVEKASYNDFLESDRMYRNETRSNLRILQKPITAG